MSPEDLSQIRAAIREEVAQQIAAAEQRMIDRHERLMEALTMNISDLRSEMNARFETVDRRFEAVERRLDRMAESLRSLETRMAALNTWADTLDRDNLSLANTQAAQQRAIDALTARVAKLEQRP